jgi:competence protein ComEA
MKLDRLVATGVAIAMACLFCAGPVLAAAKPVPTGKVNVNTATAEQLTALPGVGPKLATRIVEHRQKEGAFHSMQDLLNVKGIGEKNLAKIQGYVSLGDAARPAATK